MASRLTLGLMQQLVRPPLLQFVCDNLHLQNYNSSKSQGSHRKLLFHYNSHIDRVLSLPGSNIKCFVGFHTQKSCFCLNDACRIFLEQMISTSGNFLTRKNILILFSDPRHCLPKSIFLPDFQNIVFGMFVRLRLLDYSCLSVRPIACNNSAPNGWIFIKFDI